MWRSRRKSSSEIDGYNTLLRRSSSKLNFIHSSLKDVENLFENDDFNANRFNETLDQPSPSSTVTATATAAARRLSIFHRVHLANKFSRAFAVKQIANPDKSPPEPYNVTPLEHLTKSDGQISIPATQITDPEPYNLSPPEKLTKSGCQISIPVTQITNPELNNLTPPEKLPKPNRLISLPGAEKRVIIYTTSLRVVRSTFEACRTVQSILRGFRISIDERDLSMDSTFSTELQNIMAEQYGYESYDDVQKTKLTLPRVFIGGRYIGGAEEVKQLHESGELKKIVEGLPAVSGGACEACGDFRFVLCEECCGSHKCYIEKGGFRSCTLCNENGLIRCSFCL